MNQSYYHKWLPALAILLLISAVVSPTHALNNDSPVTRGRGAVANLAQCRLDTWGVRDGLPPQIITDITQTPDGFLWLATAGGLMRFDGEAFRKFDPKNTPGLTGDNITQVHVDKSGVLWVGGAWTGFGTFQNGKYTRIQPKFDSWSSIGAIHQTPGGTMWFAGLGTNSIFKLEGDRVRSYGGYNDSIDQLLDGGDGSLIGIEFNHGPILITPEGARTEYRLPRPLPVDMYTCACKTSDGDLWIGTLRSGVFRISHGKVTIYAGKAGLPADDVRCLYVDHENRLWLGTTSGLCCWNGHTFDSFKTIAGFTDSDIRSIFEDREGNLWVGAGTVLCRFAATKLVPTELYLGKQCIEIGSYSSLAEDPTVYESRHPHATPLLGEGAQRPGASTMGSAVWCVSMRGIAHIDARGVSWVGGPFHRPFDGISIGPDGLVWLWSHPTVGENVYAVPLADLRRWMLPPGQMPPDSPLGDNLAHYPAVYDKLQFTVAVASRGQLTAYGASGQSRFSPGRVVGHRQFQGGWTFKAARDASGADWVASTEGIRRITKTSCLHLKAQPASTHFLDIDATDPSDVWFGSDHGLQRWVHGKMRTYTSDDGLPTNEIFQVLGTADGTLWLGYHSGICSVSRADIDAFDHHKIATIPVREFGDGDGIRDYPTLFSSLKTSDGRLWFAATKSISVISPDNMQLNAIVPPVSLLDAEVDGHSLAAGDNRLKPGAGNLRVHFAALSYAAPERVQYSYRLFGFDNEWTQTRERLAVYGNLPPGKYRFQVIACNNDGVWNRTGASVNFEIAPHFYQTWWFRLLTAIVILVSMSGIFWIRTATLRRKNLELENKVAERTGALEAAMEELTSSNEQLQDIQIELEAQNSELLETRETLATANQQLENLATTDGLTGLKNHRAFQEQLGIEWTHVQRNLRPLSIVLMDVDKFKQYNDTFGHPGGDDVLRRIGAILSGCIREADFVARYGGEEFVVIAPDTGQEGATQLAERIRTAVEAAEWPLRPVTASLGVSTSTTTTVDAHALVAEADAALYRSKESGRNRVTHAWEGEATLR